MFTEKEEQNLNSASKLTNKKLQTADVNHRIWRLELLVVLSIFGFAVVWIWDNIPIKINSNYDTVSRDMEDRIMAKVDDKILSVMKELDALRSSGNKDVTDQAEKKAVVKLEKPHQTKMTSKFKISHAFNDSKESMEDISFVYSPSSVNEQTISRTLQLQESSSSSLSESSLFSLSSCTDSIFLLHTHLNLEDTNTNLELRENTSGKIHVFKSTFDDTTNFENSYFACLSPGIYLLDITYDGTQDKNPCTDWKDCYHIVINDKILLQGTDFSDAASYSFYITHQGMSRERLCHKLPMLSSNNQFDRFVQSDREDSIVTKLISISSLTALGNHKSPQYKAACWILFDDERQLSSSSKWLVDRYILALLFYSMGVNAELFIPFHTCDSDGIQCDERGFITHIQKSKLRL